MKRKRLIISPELLGDFLKRPVAPGIVADGIPEDAKIVFATWDEYGMINLILESETFSAIQYGDMIPPMDVIFHYTV